MSGPRFAPRRPLGRTGFVATRIGQGDLADRAVGKAPCVATLRRALDAGVNVVDTAPMYEDGFSEEVVGEALRGRRDGVFVVTEIDALDLSSHHPDVLAAAIAGGRCDVVMFSVEECVRYALTLDPDVALLGLSFANEQDAAFAAAAAFRPMSPGELAETRRRAGVAIDGKGSIWWNPPA